MIGLFIAKATSDDFMPTPKYQKKSEASRGYSPGTESSSHLSFSRTSKIKPHLTDAAAWTISNHATHFTKDEVIVTVGAHCLDEMDAK